MTCELAYIEEQRIKRHDEIAAKIIERRDMFIAAALAGMWAYPRCLGDCAEMAKKAIAQADAVMALLEMEESGK